ncbi:MAG: hypothetical protein QM743_04095 [Chitinophagaceae bacterium]
MDQLRDATPGVRLESENRGYPTPAHKRAIAAFGHTSYHRLTFRSEIGQR